MKLKQSFERTQPKTVKDFFILTEKRTNKPKPGDSNNFFTQLVQRSQSA
ncbi:hypothetical protein KAG03_15110 [Klebsiella variicola]|jgi:hypothetical protein|nr:hypothetical protein [Klebsiella variicola]MCB7753775.1 hypothetical protein [Klebsiella variicola]HCL6958416.1 hypothetical protein [Klebsiella variicola]